jgi:hypothetical protein
MSYLGYGYEDSHGAHQLSKPASRAIARLGKIKADRIAVLRRAGSTIIRRY